MAPDGRARDSHRHQRLPLPGGPAPGTGSPTRRGHTAIHRRDSTSSSTTRSIFDTVEVNSTFYGVSYRSVTEAWIDRTPDDFVLSVKLYSSSRSRRCSPPPRVAATPRSTAVASTGSARRLRPFRRSGSWAPCWRSSPPASGTDSAAHDHLASLIELLWDCPVAVELQHRSWSDDIAGTLRLLNGLGAVRVQIDEPKFRLSRSPTTICRTSRALATRGSTAATPGNSGGTTTPRNVTTTYSDGELRRFRDTADAGARLVEHVYLCMNNHFAAKAVANAATLKQQLGLEESGAYREDMVARYSSCEMSSGRNPGRYRCCARRRRSAKPCLTGRAPARGRPARPDRSGVRDRDRSAVAADPLPLWGSRRPDTWARCCGSGHATPPGSNPRVLLETDGDMKCRSGIRTSSASSPVGMA